MDFERASDDGRVHVPELDAVEASNFLDIRAGLVWRSQRVEVDLVALWIHVETDENVELELGDPVCDRFAVSGVLEDERQAVCDLHGRRLLSPEGAGAEDEGGVDFGVISVA